MALYNATGFIGQLIVKFTTNITGYEYITILFIIGLLLAFGFAFKIPLEYLLLICLPLLIVMMAFDQLYLRIGVIVLIFLGALLGVWFTFNK